MKLATPFLVLTALNIVILHARRVERGYPSDVTKAHDYNLKRAIRSELETASDQIVEIIAQHVEKILQEQSPDETSFIQDGWKSTAKKITKNAVVHIAKNTIPVIAAIVADSVKPPNTDVIVYNSLFKPVCKDIFDHVSAKLDIKPDDSIWEYSGDDGYEDEDENENEEDDEFI